MVSENTFEASLSNDLKIKFQPAPTFKRIAAYVIDLSLVTVGFYLLFIIGAFIIPLIVIPLGVWGSKALGAYTAIIIFALISLIVLSAFHGYFIYCEYKYGATVGKKLFGLKVFSAENKRLTAGQCAVREFMRWIDCTLVLPGLISVLLTGKRQRLGDLMAGTVVTYQKKEEDTKNFMYIKQDQYNLLVSELRPRPIPRADCENFLALAFQFFVRNNRDTRVIEALHEETKKFSSCLENHQHDKIDPIFLQLFIAEHCFQELHHGSSNQPIN